MFEASTPLPVTDFSIPETSVTESSDVPSKPSTDSPYLKRLLDESTTLRADTRFTTTTPSPPSNASSLYETSSAPVFDMEDGACVYDGKIYQSAEQIPRPHPCDFCFCFRGDIICLQQTCPPPVSHCVETHIEGFCCPRFECPVQAQTMNKTVITNQRMVRHSVSSVTSTTTSRPLPYSVTVIEKKGCRINGHFYEVGQRVNSASNPCLDCRCAPNGLMSCSPIKCSTQTPLLFRMNRSFFNKK